MENAPTAVEHCLEQTLEREVENAPTAVEHCLEQTLQAGDMTLVSAEDFDHGRQPAHRSTKRTRRRNNFLGVSCLGV